MAKIKWDGATLLAPVPAVLITCGSGEDANVFTVAWTGIISSKPPRTYISVRRERYSYDLIKKSGEFAINLTTQSLVKQTDYCGVVSRKREDKIDKLKLELNGGMEISVPSLAASPISLECRVFDVVELGSHDMFLADILCVTVDDKLIGKSGKLNLDSAGLIAYSHGSYYSLGECLGSFGFSVRKKK